MNKLAPNFANIFLENRGLFIASFSTPISFYRVAHTWVSFSVTKIKNFFVYTHPGGFCPRDCNSNRLKNKWHNLLNLQEYFKYSILPYLECMGKLVTCSMWGLFLIDICVRLIEFYFNIHYDICYIHIHRGISISIWIRLIIHYNV